MQHNTDSSSTSWCRYIHTYHTARLSHCPTISPAVQPRDRYTDQFTAHLFQPPKNATGRIAVTSVLRPVYRPSSTTSKNITDRTAVASTHRLIIPPVFESIQPFLSTHLPVFQSKCTSSSRCRTPASNWSVKDGKW